MRFPITRIGIELIVSEIALKSQRDYPLVENKLQTPTQRAVGTLHI